MESLSARTMLVRGADGVLYQLHSGVCESVPDVTVAAGAAGHGYSGTTGAINDYASGRLMIEAGDDHASSRLMIEPSDDYASGRLMIEAGADHASSRLMIEPSDDYASGRLMIEAGDDYASSRLMIDPSGDLRPERVAMLADGFQSWRPSFTVDPSRI